MDENEDLNDYYPLGVDDGWGDWTFCEEINSDDEEYLKNCADSTFSFESDHAALKGNTDYHSLVKALALLQVQRVQAVKTPMECPDCGVNMRTATDRRRCLGWRYVCALYSRKISPVANTLLDGVRLEDLGADTLVKLAFNCLTDLPQSSSQQRLFISRDTSVAWYGYFRDVACKIAWHDFDLVGGPGDVVEMDEVKLFKRKYGRGRLAMWQNGWLYGGISRTNQNVFGHLVPNRNTDTLMELAVNAVDPDTYICADLWGGYNAPGQYFDRGVGRVNHSIQFLNPPRDQEPLWRPAGSLQAACLDKQ